MAEKAPAEKARTSSSKSSSSSKTAGRSEKISASKFDSQTKPGSVAEKAIYRNILLYSILRKNLLLLGIAVVSAVFSAYMLYYFITRSVPPRYVPITADNRLFPDKPLTDHTTYPDSDVVNFAITAVKRINTYDWYNYRYQLQQAVGDFTPEAWGNLNTELVASGNLKAITSQKLVVSFTPTGVPNITKQTVENGYYTWQIDIPSSVVYHGFQDENSQNGVITVKVRRASLGESDSGLLLEFYVFTIGNPGDPQK